MEHGESYHSSYLSCSKINSHVNTSSADGKGIVTLMRCPSFVGCCARKMQKIENCSIKYRVETWNAGGLTGV